MSHPYSRHYIMTNSIQLVGGGNNIQENNSLRGSKTYIAQNYKKRPLLFAFALKNLSQSFNAKHIDGAAFVAYNSKVLKIKHLSRITCKYK